jgi:hypothetical protein
MPAAGTDLPSLDRGAVAMENKELILGFGLPDGGDPDPWPEGVPVITLGEWTYFITEWEKEQFRRLKRKPPLHVELSDRIISFAPACWPEGWPY